MNHTIETMACRTFRYRIFSHLAVAVVVFSGVLSSCCWAATGPTDAEIVPQLDEEGQQAYWRFLRTPEPRAFAIASGGGWGYSLDASTDDQARKDALKHCQNSTEQKCQLYAVNKSVVLDTSTWTASWGPYLDAQQAGRAQTGIRLGQRFPELVFTDREGHGTRLSDLRGQAVVLHFWASWCGPCQFEMPEVERLDKATRTERGLRFAFIRAPGSYDRDPTWAVQIAPDVHLTEATLTLANGQRVTDPDFLVKVYPSTYVIDKHGIVDLAPEKWSS